jgi:PAS domain S-box-containing protein
MNHTRFWSEAIVDSSNDAIIGEDLSGVVTSWNKAAETMFGYTATEIIGQLITRIIPPDRIDERAALLKQIRRNERVEHFDARRQREDGTIISVALTASPIRDEQGGIIGISTIARDCTVRDERERQLRAANTELERLARHLSETRVKTDRATRAQSRFLAGVSHELRTPLNGILGYAQLLHMEGGLSPAQNARVDAMLGAGEHLLEMITCVLDLSRIEAEHLELQTVEIDAEAVAAACLELVRSSAEAKHITLTTTVAPNTPKTLVADPVQLRQVLFNLLGNAVTNTSRGAIELRLRTAADGSALQFEVVGSSRELSAKQTNRWRDTVGLDTEATPVTEDAEPGLALASQLAQLMGGRVGHADNPDGGTVSWLELPLDTSSTPAPAPAATAVSTQDHLASLRPLSVLVVDDVAMIRDLAASMLRMAGHTVVCLEGGAEAVEAIATADFDVVLMDVRMPEMDGLEATRRIRALAGTRGRVPIVALTAQAFPEQVDECHNAGMNGHVSKPFNIDTLSAAVMNAAMAGLPQGQTQETMPTEMIFPPVKQVIGEDLQLVDPNVFERTALVPTPGMVASYLRTIAALGEALLLRLQGPRR